MSPVCSLEKNGIKPNYGLLEIIWNAYNLSLLAFRLLCHITNINKIVSSSQATAAATEMAMTTAETDASEEALPARIPIK